MKKMIAPLIQPSELAAILGHDDLVIVNATGGKDARENYETNHIDGAVFLDLDTHLADIKPDAAFGGRHPLPSPRKFSEVLSSIGITNGSHVIVYDNMSGANAAARLWWMLKSLGHQKVQVLDGGIQGAMAFGLPVNGIPVRPSASAHYVFKEWSLPLSDMQEVEKVANDKNFLVIDVRDYERYAGRKEPIDLIAGHIPGAINIPFMTNLDSEGFYLPSAELRDKYIHAFGKVEPKNIVVHCGSGVTACHTLLAMAHAGLEIPKLYVGSWSEWSRNDKPIATEV